MVFVACCCYSITKVRLCRRTAKHAAAYLPHTRAPKLLHLRRLAPRKQKSARGRTGVSPRTDSSLSAGGLEFVRGRTSLCPRSESIMSAVRINYDRGQKTRTFRLSSVCRLLSSHRSAGKAFPPYLRQRKRRKCKQKAAVQTKTTLSGKSFAKPARGYVGQRKNKRVRTAYVWRTYAVRTL